MFSGCLRTDMPQVSCAFLRAGAVHNGVTIKELGRIKEWVLTLNVSDDFRKKVENCTTLEELDAVASFNVAECGWLNLEELGRLMQIWG